MLYRHCLDTWHSLNDFHYIKILIIILLYTNIGLQLHHSAEELVHINYGFGIYNKNIFINWKVKFVLFICFSVQKQADVQTFVTKVSLPALYIKLRKIFLRCVTFVFLSSFIPFSIFQAYLLWKHFYVIHLLKSLISLSTSVCRNCTLTKQFYKIKITLLKFPS